MTRLYKPKESDLKKQVTEYLQYLSNCGKIWFTRLNSGEIISLNKDGTTRKIQLCPVGTADILIIIFGRSIFCELKRKGGKQSKDQYDFQVKVESVSAIYWLIDDFDEFKSKIDKVLGG